MSPQEKMTQLIEECGSIRAVAEKLNISRSMIAGVSKGTVNPGMRTLHALGMMPPSLPPYAVRQAERRERIAAKLLAHFRRFKRPASAFDLSGPGHSEAMTRTHLEALVSQGRAEAVGGMGRQGLRFLPRNDEECVLCGNEI
jgi:hypothetical protein